MNIYKHLPLASSPCSATGKLRCQHPSPWSAMSWVTSSCVPGCLPGPPLEDLVNAVLLHACAQFQKKFIGCYLFQVFIFPTRAYTQHVLKGSYALASPDQTPCCCPSTYAAGLRKGNGLGPRRRGGPRTGEEGASQQGNAGGSGITAPSFCFT